MKPILLALALLSTAAFAQTNPEEKRIIGKDSRKRVTARTWRPVHDSIGYLMLSFSDSYGSCTGTVIGPRHVITAAHCLVDKKGNFAEKVVFLPGLNGNPFGSQRPFGTFQATKLRVLKKYLKSNATEDDLGLITVDSNLPVPALPLGVVPKNITKITIAGYPGDKEDGTLWEASGKRHLGIFGGTTSSHEVDTMAGQSGAAVRANLFGVETIVAIHSAGVDNWIFSDNNLALFLTGDLLNLLRKWMAED